MPQNIRLSLKIDTAENWGKAVNFVPMNGEPIIYSGYTATNAEGVEEVFPPRMKIGDGVTKVGDLPFTIEYMSDDELTAILNVTYEDASSVVL